MGTKLDFPGGGHIIVNNPAMLPGITQSILDFNRESDQFHSQLMELGVKAYRCNDGWVNRDNHIVTFFAFERERGWYWGNMNLKKGDRIFLRNPSGGGQFAIIDEVVDKDLRSARYRYQLIDEYIRFDTPKPKSKLSKIRDYIVQIFKKHKQNDD